MSKDPSSVQLGAWVAHELKNSLQVVRSLVELAERQSREARGLFAEIQDMVSRMDGLVRGFMAQAVPLVRCRLDLAELARRVLVELRPRASAAGITLVDHLATVSVDADAARLREALVNLLGNALEATPTGGRVEVELRAGERAELEIRDTGRGMGERELDRIGREFFTTRADGSGLGAIIAAAIVREHGGELSYASRPGAGTVVRVSLPLEKGEGERGDYDSA